MEGLPHKRPTPASFVVYLQKNPIAICKVRGLLNLLAIAGPMLLAVSSPDRVWGWMGLRGLGFGVSGLGRRGGMFFLRLPKRNSPTLNPDNFGPRALKRPKA